jgi:hypothetical protein
MLSYSACQGEEEGEGVENRSGGSIDIDVPDKIACHVTVRTTRYLYRERIPTRGIT